MNGNGRTATCLMNIFLRACELPSIVLRYEADTKDPNSLYSKAIDQIDTTRDPLKVLIKQRIIKEQQEISVVEPVQQLLVKLQLINALLCEELVKNGIKYDVNQAKNCPKKEIVSFYKQYNLMSNAIESDVENLERFRLFFGDMKYLYNLLPQKKLLNNNISNFFQPQSRPYEIYDQAVQKFKEEKYGNAIELLNNALKEFKKDKNNNDECARCYSTLASCYRKLNNLATALEYCKLAFEQNSTDPKIVNNIQKKYNDLEKLQNDNNNVKQQLSI